jgi:hypothetical protein
MKGSENMTTQNDTRQDKQESARLADRLPELDEEDVKKAENTNQKSWAYYNMNAGIGYVWTMPDHGVTLQVSSEDTMRLLTVVDHNWCIYMVACIKATLGSIGFKLDLSKAIVAPYNEEGNQVTTRIGAPAVEQEVSGVEVV